MPKFKSKPNVVEAEQWLKESEAIPGLHFDENGNHWCVTIHGDKAPVVVGDWLIREPDGEHYYPCKPDVFAKRYEPLEKLPPVRVPTSCPRSPDGMGFAPAPGYTGDDCFYCGSMNTDRFMARIEAGDVELVPSDKDYKVYVRNKGGADFKQVYGDKDANGEHIWVTRDMAETKFYFYHLSEDQKKRFVELLNAKKLNIGYPGHFYRMPFFIEK